MRFNGATWKGTYSSSPARYFRAYAEYHLIDGANTLTIQVSELGIEKTSGGSAEMVANTTKRATLTAKSGTTTVGNPISLSTSNALNFGASNPNAKSLGSGSIVINKTTSSQTITLEIFADKSGGDTSTAWGGKSNGTMQITVPAYGKPVVTISTTRSTTTDTSATVIAKVSSFVGDTITNFLLNVGGSSQTLTGGTIPSAGFISRTVNLTNLSTGSINCTLSATGIGGTSNTVTGVIQSAFRTLHFGAKGKSIGVGTSAREITSVNGNCDVAMDVNFTGKLQKNGVDIGTGGGGTTNYEDLSNKPVINGVTVSGEKALSDYGITNNIGTITEIKMNGVSKGTSGSVDLGTVLTSHQSLSGYVPTSRTINSKALTSNITLTASDVGAYSSTNPNGYTSNAGTITGIKMNGVSKGTSGVVDLGTVLTSHQTLKTINNQAITGSGNITISGGTPTITKTAITPTMKSGYTLSSNSSYYIKELGLVVLNMTINGSIPNGTKEVLTLPSAYYPSQSIAVAVYRSSAYWITGYISTSGVITIRSNNSATGNVQISASYWV